MAISNLPKLNFSVPFAMTAALPLEYNAYFDSYDSAVAAAATADVPGSTTTVYYYGQKIVVVGETSADLYIIQPDKTLKAAGTIPIATDTLLGVVKSSAEINKIAVGADGVMSVNTISTDKLEQGSDTIVWNGGGASV